MKKPRHPFHEKFSVLWDRAWSYIVFKGGRGSLKSWSIARHLLLRGKDETIRVGCFREFQKSIKDSVHKLLRDQIELLGLSARYRVTDNSIVGINGTEFLFAGLKHNATSIKSMEGLDVAWVEEGETISEDSWDILLPTIRKPGSVVIVSYNPSEETDPTDVRFVKNKMPNSVVVPVNWRDADQLGWFSKKLRAEKDYDFRVDLDKALWKWEGEYRKQTDAQIFKGKCFVEEFEVPMVQLRPGLVKSGWDGPYFGEDFGFSVDPGVVVKLWINSSLNELMVEYAISGLGIITKRLGKELIEPIPGAKHGPIFADSARPETIADLVDMGYNVQPAKKWAGSVEDGIEFLRSFDRIVIHPRCELLIEEAKWYRYKVDRLTRVVTRDIVDANNHGWDAIRYALQPIIYHKEESTSEFYSEEVIIDSYLDAVDRL